MSKHLSTVDFIIAYENGKLSVEDTITGFQELINSGLIWGLQGSYIRTATRLIESGHCKRSK